MILTGIKYVFQNFFVQTKVNKTNPKRKKKISLYKGLLNKGLDVSKFTQLHLEHIYTDTDWSVLLEYLENFQDSLIKNKCHITFHNSVLTYNAYKLTSYLNTNGIKYTFKSSCKHHPKVEFLIDNKDNEAILENYWSHSQNIQAYISKGEEIKNASGDSKAKLLKAQKIISQLPSKSPILFLSHDYWGKRYTAINNNNLTQEDESILSLLYFNFQLEFKDVAQRVFDKDLEGLNEAKDIIIKNFTNFYSAGKFVDNILFEGPPGTGKSTLGVVGSKVAAVGEIASYLVSRIDVMGLYKMGPLIFDSLSKDEIQTFQKKYFKKYKESVKYMGIYPKKITRENFGGVLLSAFYESIYKFAFNNIDHLYKILHGIIPLSGLKTANAVTGNPAVFVAAEPGKLVEAIVNRGPLVSESQNILESLSQKYLKTSWVLKNIKSDFGNPDFYLDGSTIPFRILKFYKNVCIAICDELEKYCTKDGTALDNTFLSILNMPNNAYKDNFLGDQAAISLDGVLFIFTANETTHISPPVKNRCKPLFVPALNAAQILNRSKKIINYKITESDLKKYVIIPNDFINLYIANSSRNTVGFRDTNQAINDLMTAIKGSSYVQKYIFFQKHGRLKKAYKHDNTIRLNKDKLVIDEKFINTLPNNSKCFLNYYRADNFNKKSTSFVAVMASGDYARCRINSALTSSNIGIQGIIKLDGNINFPSGQGRQQYESQKASLENKLKVIISKIPAIKQALYHNTIFVEFSGRLNASVINELLVHIVKDIVKKYCNTRPLSSTVEIIAGVNASGQLTVPGGDILEKIKSVKSFNNKLKRFIIPYSLKKTHAMLFKKHNIKVIYVKTLNEALRIIFGKDIIGDNGD